MNARLSIDSQIDLPMSRKDISDHLGLSTETISRIMSQFHRTKIIQFGDQTQRRILIRDKKRLEQLASDPSNFECLKPR